MTRTFYALGGLAAMALIVFTQTFVLTPDRLVPAASPPRGEAATPPLPQEPGGAIDDLAAWPIAATR